MPDMTDLIGETDAHVWARKWLEHVSDRPELALDEGTVIGWFANAIQAGTDDFFNRRPDLARLVAVRSDLRQDEPLPDWAPEQWVAALAIKLGQASLTLMGPRGEGFEEPEELALACKQLMALAAGALDAVEALEK